MCEICVLHYPGISTSGAVCISEMIKFYVKVFYMMGKALSGQLSCTRTVLFNPLRHKK